MPRSKKCKAARLEGLQAYRRKEHKAASEENSDNEDIGCFLDANTSSCSLETGESDEQMDIDKGTPDKGTISGFWTRLETGLKDWLQKLAERKRAAKYSKGAPLADLPARTQQHKKRKLRIETAQLRMQGFPDIRSVFKKQKTCMPNTINHDVIDLTALTDNSQSMEDVRTHFAPEMNRMGVEESRGGENGCSGQKELNAVDKSVSQPEQPCGPAVGSLECAWMWRMEEEEEEGREEDAVGKQAMVDEDDVPVTRNPSSSPIHNNCQSTATSHQNIYSGTRTSDNLHKTNPNCSFRPPIRHSSEIIDGIHMLDCLQHNKLMDLLLRGRVTIMLALLRLYKSNNEISWVEASMLAATIAGRGPHLARNVRRWCRHFLEDNECLPVNLYGTWKTSIIADEDFRTEIQEYLTSLRKEYLSVHDVLDYLNKPNVLSKLGRTKPVTLRTANTWMHAMGYRYGKAENGMYIDGHERPDVVDYRAKFLAVWAELERRMANGQLQPNERPLIHITHDESTFYAHDQRKTRWIHCTEKAKPRTKGEGTSLMVSDFCIPEHGWLHSEDGTKEARIYFRAGKNRDGYFTNDDLLKQVKTSIDIFDERFPNSQAVFTFDNATSHQKRAPDAISARHMPKNAGWKGQKAVQNMRPGRLSDGTPQSFYYPADHENRKLRGEFKGMRQILIERGLRKEAALYAECKGFKCVDEKASCCCRRVLFNQPDFQEAKPALVEYIESRGHLAVFLPKFHCELNFIEQCWGYAKYRYRMLPRPKNEDEMHANIKHCLDSVPLASIQKFADRSARFMDAYRRGLDGEQAAWANRVYHGHRVLPTSILSELERRLHK